MSLGLSLFYRTPVRGPETPWHSRGPRNHTTIAVVRTCPAGTTATFTGKRGITCNGGHMGFGPIGHLWVSQITPWLFGASRSALVAYNHQCLSGDLYGLQNNRQAQTLLLSSVSMCSQVIRIMSSDKRCDCKQPKHFSKHQTTTAFLQKLVVALAVQQAAATKV